MWSKVKDYINKYKLLKDNELYIVALSGGADSVALLLYLRESGYRLHAAHCNFKLRGAESDRDEHFCISLCERLNIPLHRAHFDTLTYAEFHKQSIEMAARELRYHWFENLRKDLCADGVCVAHHRDDTVETVLLNLVRGTGLRGLTGIQPRNGYILRPLLGISRQEIEDYLALQHQDYVTDSTNLEADVLRNKVRLDVLPLLRTLNPAVSENIQRSAEHLSQAQAVLDTVLSVFKERKILKYSDIDKFGSREYLIYEWLKNYGFNGAQVPQIVSARTGSVFSSQTGYDVLVDRDCWMAEPTLKPLKMMQIPEPGTYVMEDGTHVAVRIVTPDADFQVSKSPDYATLDAEKLFFPLTVRRVQNADWMIPFGMKGRKLLSDIMTDRKMSVFQKRRQLVVADAAGNIVWLVGLRTDNRYRVKKSTSKVCCLSFS